MTTLNICENYKLTLAINLTMSNAQKILQALQQTVLGSSTEQIKNAEALLRSYQSGEDFVDNINLILQQSKIDKNLQKSAAVYLNKHANNAVKSKNQQLINTTAQKILKLLSNYKIDSKHKIHISRALEYMISSDKSKIIRSAFQPNLIAMLGQAEQQEDQNVNFQFLVFFGQILMNNPGFTEQVWKFISKSFTPFLKLAIRVQNLLEQVLTAQNGELAAKLLFLTREYLYLLKIYLKRFLFIDIQANKLLFSPQLQVIITKSLAIALPNNTLKYPIFHLVPNPTPQQKILNQIKSNAVSFLNNLIRTLLGIVKQPKIMALNPVYAKTHTYLVTLIQASQQIMKSAPYYKINDMSLLNTLDQVYSLYITTLRANSFYQVFVQYKQKMIQDLIFRALVLTPNDYENYYQNPEEFINALVHVIQKDVKIKQRKQADDEPDNEIQCFATLRTHAAEFLNTFCKHQDGTLTEIVQYAALILQGKNKSQFTPSLMLIIIAILRDISKQRKDLNVLTSNIIMKLLTEMQIPRQNTQLAHNSSDYKQSDIQYSLVLFLLQKTFPRVLSVNLKIMDYSFKLCHKILNDPIVGQVPKLLAIDIIQVINHLEQGQPYSPQVLKTFNSLLKSQQFKPSQRLLEAYFSLIKYNDVILKKLCYNQLIEMVNQLAFLIKQEVQKPDRQQILINKLWNVIREVGQNPQFIPLMIQPIQNAIMPLLPFVDGTSQVDFQEDILMLMSSFIGKSHQVTQNQLKMFEIIPRIFYSHYKATFGHSFETLQTFIYYGKEILKTSPAAINSIIHMGLTSVSSKQYKGTKLVQSDSCQGALLIQSLIVGCGLSIETKAYEQIVQTVRKRLSEPIKFDLLKANLVALLALVLIHSCENFSNQANDIILSSILNQICCFKKVKHAPKILIIALNKLLSKFQFQFVTRRYTQILDTVITLLQMISMKKDNLFDQEDDDEQRDYANSLIQTVNDVIKMDEFQDFKNQIKVLKEQNLSLIQRTVNELPLSKKDFLKNILAVQRVSNQPRKIFTIKRKN